MKLTDRPALSSGGMATWHSSGRTEPISAAVTKNAGALARKGILRNMTVATSGGRYAEIAPAKIKRMPTTRSTVSGLRCAVAFSERYEPAAMPARYVESKSAKAGARSDEAIAKTRNQAISNPRAMKPDRPPNNIAAVMDTAAEFCADGEVVWMFSFSRRE